MQREHIVIDGERWDIMDEVLDKSDAIVSRDDYKYHLHNVMGRPNAVLKIDSRKDGNGVTMWMVLARG
jgi:hypothetical protein